MMALRHWTGIRFINRAPTRSGHYVRMRVTRLTFSLVRWWHSHVQPVIDRDSNRVDNDWNWLLYASFAAAAGMALRREPVGYVIGIVPEEGEHLIPCSMLMMLGRIPALDNHRKKSAFAWYLTTAPVEALLSIKEVNLTEDMLPRRMGTIALDVAITHSFNHRRMGRMALYADNRGGDKLLTWYKKQGMQVLPSNSRLPRGPRRLFKPSDGRYCYFTPKAAMAASRRLDNLRA